MSSSQRIPLGLILGIVAGACSAPSDLGDSVGHEQFDSVGSTSASLITPAPDSDSPCHPLAAGHCQLPYPSNWFTTDDPSSATGRRLRYPDSLLRAEIASNLPQGFELSSLLGNQEGFPVSGPVLFEVATAPDPDSVTDGSPLADGPANDLAVVVFDLTTGARVPVYADASAFAAGVGSGKHVIQVFPRTKFAFGHRYVAALTDTLRPKNDGDPPYAKPALFSDSAQEKTRAFVYHEPLLRFLESRGVERRRLLSVTDFSTRTEADATGRMYRQMRTVYDQEHPIRHVVAWPSIYPDVNTIVTGDVRLSDFRGPNGDIDDNDVTGKEDWQPFTLTIPNSAKDAPAPVVFYGHPLIGDHHLLAFVASANAKRGYATISIDIPNHGVRSLSDGGHVLMLHDPSKLGPTLGMMAQAPLDQVALLKAIRTSFADLDLAPRTLLGRTGDGKPDLDGSKVVVEGLSMGGVLATGFMGGAGALGLGLKGACLQVSGVGMTNILAHSQFWAAWFSALVPQEADGAESLWYLAVAGQRMELADGLTVADRIDFPVAMTYGIGDEIVSAHSALALAELAHSPLLNPTIKPEEAPFLEYVGPDYPRTQTRGGAGVLQVQNRPSGFVPLNFETHLTFLKQSNYEQIDSFLSQL